MKLLLTFLCFHLFVLSNLALAEKRLAVFIPLSASPREVEKKLRADPVLDGIEPMVFAKFDDFLDIQQKKPFDYAILPSFYSQYYSDFKPLFRFRSGSSETFHYLILSIEKQWTAEKLTEGTLGIVDELGRENMKKYVSSVVKKADLKKLKRVTKYDDIFPLLAMGNADYTMIPENLMDYLKQKYKSNLIEVSRSEAIPNPILFVQVKTGEDKSPPFERLGSQTLKVLGFDHLVQLP